MCFGHRVAREAQRLRRRRGRLVVLAAVLLCAAPAAAGSSPFEAPPPTDRAFVADQGPLLDTDCLYRSGGPIEFEIEVTRVVGEVNGDGTLRDPATLIANKVVSATASLKLPAFDVDYDAEVEPPYQPERDLVSINGHELGFLTGSDEVWKLNSFEVPIEHLRFPARAALGGAPAPARNVVRIDIDTANEEERWCTSIDWGVLSFKAQSPVVLVHGNSSDGAFWDRRGFAAALTAARIPYDNSISMSPNANLIVPNARQLDQLLPPIAQSFGVDSLHLVAHSKGGLDSREFLATYARAHRGAFTVLSLSTLSTPHRGSAGNDLLIAQVQANWIEGAGVSGDLLPRILSPNAGTPDLTTWSTTTFNATNSSRLPTGTHYRAIGADADQNGNRRIDRVPDEFAGDRAEDSTLGGLPLAVSVRAVNNVYQLLRTVGSVSVVTRTKMVFGVTVATYRVGVASPGGGPSDTAVTIASAGGLAPFTALPAFTGANGRDHGTVANGAAATTLLPHLQATEAAIGDFR